jgi:hypothetical protein
MFFSTHSRASSYGWPFLIQVLSGLVLIVHTSPGQLLPITFPDSLPRTLPGAEVAPWLKKTGFTDRTSWQMEVGGFASSSGTVPFWLQTNQFGIVPKLAPTGLIKATVHREYQAATSGKSPKMDWGYGFEVVGWTGTLNQALLSEGYLKGRLGKIELMVGRRRQIIGLAESSLSSGSYIWSGNALPVPQVQLSIPDYVPLKFSRGFIALKGFYSHGWFGNGPYVQKSFLHQKAIYLRLGKPTAKVRLYGAFTHLAQWGGHAPFLERDPTSSFDGELAQSLEAYLNVVLPMKTDALKNRAKFTTFDQNRVGDHRGSAELSLEIKLGETSLYAYQQHFYDLGRKLYNLRNIEDGLYGLRLVNHKARPFFEEVVLELFNSGNQGVLQFGKSLGGEAENYFLNGQYPESWSYQGRTLGTPFISQASDTRADLPRLPFSGYTLDNTLIEGVHGINNNRVRALYGAVSGWLGSDWHYLLKASYSQNYGMFAIPFPAETMQLSMMTSLTKSIRWFGGSSLLLAAGYDQGQLLASAEQIGGYLGLRKSWKTQ